MNVVLEIVLGLALSLAGVLFSLYLMKATIWLFWGDE